jgi:hypothetical protein
MFKRLPDEKYYRKFYFQDSFYAQCMDVEPLTMIQFDRAVAEVKKIIDNPIFRTCRHIIGTGCGDSNIGIFDFTMTDILWWKEKKSATSFILKDDKQFKKEVKLALLEIMDKYSAAMGEKLAKQAKTILKKLETEGEDAA